MWSATVLLITFTTSEVLFILLARYGRTRSWMRGWRRLSGAGYAMVCFAFAIVDVIRGDVFSVVFFAVLTVWTVLRMLNGGDELSWRGQLNERPAAR